MGKTIAVENEWNKGSLLENKEKREGGGGEKKGRKKWRGKKGRGKEEREEGLKKVTSDQRRKNCSFLYLISFLFITPGASAWHSSFPSISYGTHSQVYTFAAAAAVVEHIFCSVVHDSLMWSKEK